jgi:flagellar basal-body rod protein FlgF
MIKGIYDSASGMLPRILKQETYANNMANVNTPGFKKDGIFLQHLNNAADGSLITDLPWEIPMVNDIYIDFSQGALERTDNQLNLALEGDGFFVIQTDAGIRYTRNGSFSTSPQGILTDSNGNPVLSDSGPLTVSGNDVVIAADGTVSVDGAGIGNLKIADFDRPYRLTKAESSYFVPADETVAERAAQDVRVMQGYLEKSNVNVIDVMVDMLASFRAYEAGQKAIRAQDETLDKAVNDLGRVT